MPNFYFWDTADYFARAAEFKPLIHTWSLGVEEQYYLLLPVLPVMRVELEASVAAAILTGAAISHVPQSFRATLEGQGIGAEVMASPTAARTYNVLLGEGRRVAVALIPVD